MNRRRPVEGFAVLSVVIILAVVIAAGFTGYRLWNAHNSATSEVVWAYNEQTNAWFAKTGKPPACRQPFTFDYSPVDLSLVNVIDMPGAYRGYSYKPHGGIRMDGIPSGNVVVKMPIDATLVGLTRYYEGDPVSLQYLLTFETDCGIAFRFDHLYTLTPEFQRIADTTPQPKVNDTQVDPNISFARTKFKAGEVVATTVGFPANQNIGFDFGVYDYRQPNEISGNTKWAAIHNTYQSLEWYGVCWLDMLPGADAAKATELSRVILNPAKPLIVSDYCPGAPHTTLDINNGLPTGG